MLRIGLFIVLIAVRRVILGILVATRLLDINPPYPVPRRRNCPFLPHPSQQADSFPNC